MARSIKMSPREYKPKYKVGDSIEFTGSTNIIQITSIEDGKYHFKYTYIAPLKHATKNLRMGFGVLESGTRKLPVDVAKVWREALNGP